MMLIRLKKYHTYLKLLFMNDDFPFLRYKKNNDFIQPIREKIFNSNFYNSFGLNKDSIEKMFTIHNNGEEDLKWLIYSLYSLSIWNNKHHAID